MNSEQCQHQQNGCLVCVLRDRCRHVCVCDENEKRPLPSNQKSIKQPCIERLGLLNGDFLGIEFKFYKVIIVSIALLTVKYKLFKKIIKLYIKDTRT